MTRRIAHAAQIGGLLLALALVPVALAAKGGKPGGGGGTNGSGSSLGLVMVSDANGDGVPNYGDTVTFDVSTSASYPSVELDCYQDGALVYAHIAGFYPSYGWSKDYTLAGGNWTGGAADCTATLYHTTRKGTNLTLATLGFQVGS